MWISRRKYNAMLDMLIKSSEQDEREVYLIEDLYERNAKLLEENAELISQKADLEKRLRFFGIEIGLPPDPEKDKLDFPKVTKI